MFTRSSVELEPIAMARALGVLKLFVIKGWIIVVGVQLSKTRKGIGGFRFALLLLKLTPALLLRVEYFYCGISIQRIKFLILRIRNGELRRSIVNDNTRA